MTLTHFKYLTEEGFELDCELEYFKEEISGYRLQSSYCQLLNSTLNGIDFNLRLTDGEVEEIQNKALRSIEQEREEEQIDWAYQRRYG